MEFRKLSEVPYVEEAPDDAKFLIATDAGTIMKTNCGGGSGDSTYTFVIGYEGNGANTCTLIKGDYASIKNAILKTYPELPDPIVGYFVGWPRLGSSISHPSCLRAISIVWDSIYNSIICLFGGTSNYYSTTAITPDYLCIQINSDGTCKHITF